MKVFIECSCGAFEAAEGAIVPEVTSLSKAGYRKTAVRFAIHCSYAAVLGLTHSGNPTGHDGHLGLMGCGIFVDVIDWMFATV